MDQKCAAKAGDEENKQFDLDADDEKEDLAAVADDATGIDPLAQFMKDDLDDDGEELELKPGKKPNDDDGADWRP